MDLLHCCKIYRLCGKRRKKRSRGMRIVDDSHLKYAAVLRVMQTWKQLPESDIARILRQYFLITDDFREMEDEGLLTMVFTGDEYLITPTLLGRIWLEQYSPEEH